MDSHPATEDLVAALEADFEAQFAEENRIPPRCTHCKLRIAPDTKHKPSGPNECTPVRAWARP